MADRPIQTRKTALRALALVLVLAASSGAAFAVGAGGPADCDSPLPFVLNVGLPYLEGASAEDAVASLEPVVGDRYRRSAACPSRPLQVNVALGSDYQILDWVDRGLIDMAVVPDLALFLLTRDGLDLAELDDPSVGSMAQLVGRYPCFQRTVVEGGEVSTSSGSTRHLETFAAGVWEREIEGEEEIDPGFLVLPSHLSTPGFLIPMLDIEVFLSGRPEVVGATVEDRRRFWEGFYDRVCFRFDADLGYRDTDACRASEGSPLLEIEVLDDIRACSENADEGPPALGRDISYRDRLVIRREVAERIFRPGTFAPVDPPDGDPLDRLDDLFDRESDADEEKPPVVTAFDAFLEPDRYFGTRTFAFRLGETLDLIEMHQEISSRASLALVLPGGGVKAAYQSRLIDELYGPGLDHGGARLRNAGAVDEPAGENGRALRVDSVVGTSGGALLGFFVARLGPDGPLGLSRILWAPGDRPRTEKPDYLTASEIFGFTDLPRYISLVVVLCVFGAVIGLFARRPNDLLASRAQANGMATQGLVNRRTLGVSLFLLLLLTPLVVAWVSGSLLDEHVPEFEGLLYAVLLVLAMYADQCLLKTEVAADVDAEDGAGDAAGEPSPAVIPRWVPLAIGGVLAVAPAVLAFFEAGRALIETEVTTGGAYLVLGSLAALLGAVAVGPPRPGQRVSPRAIVLGGFVLGTLLAWLLLPLAGEAILTWTDQTPLLFLALGLAIVVTALIRIVESEWRPDADGPWRRASGWVMRQTERALDQDAERARVLVVSVFCCFVALDLARPAADAFLEHAWWSDGNPWWSNVTATSKLHAPRGAFAVCLGSIFLLLGTISCLRRGQRYRMRGQERFSDAALLVITSLAFAVFAGILLFVTAIGWLSELAWLQGSPLLADLSEVTLFELTPGYWISLALASYFGSIALVIWAGTGSGAGRHQVSAWLRRTLAFLCERHPHGDIVTRRVMRMGVIAVGGLFWWNFVLAPALYGNRYALGYVEQADERFETEYCESHLGDSRCEAEERTTFSYRLTARYLAPANALGAPDATRFVLAVSELEDCPPVPLSPGVTWRRFRAHGGEGFEVREDGCTDLDLSNERELEALFNYIFASGSPFPAFPARRVPVPEEGRLGEDPELEALVDGGYSNNVPIEAAAKIGARQALVIHSSHPRPEESEDGWFAAVAGPLVENLPRLFSFLYERSQQLDRRSRSDLFVVSLAPLPDRDWPLLTDFRSATVARMIDTAEGQLGDRIGMVESWGPPEFQAGLRVAAAEAAAPERRSVRRRSSARRATPRSPPPPARGRSR